MGKVMSVLSRKVNRFNVENRAHRLLDKEKPVPAPKHKANLQDLKRASEVDPDFTLRQSQKDVNLDERLKQVFVTSKDSFIDYGIKRKDNKDKTLPADRTTVENFEIGFMEPRTVSRGRCTLRQAMKFITDYQGDPNLWTVERIAEDYKLKKEVVGHILANFRSFQIYLPDKSEKKGIITQAKQKLQRITDDTSKT